MKIYQILFCLVISMASFQKLDAKCQENYKSYKKAVIASPITAPMISSTHMAEGALSTTGNLLYGIARTDTGLSIAGAANGIAFSYEGHFYLELMSSNLRHFSGRNKVLKILNQAELGIGDDLENLLDDLNDSLEEEELELTTLIELINSANQNDVFCPKNKELFTFKNLRRYILGLSQ